ncbi:MAG: hypothetical protein ACRD00_07625, partial [Thermoanaerobaculia bacterium]
AGAVRRMAALGRARVLGAGLPSDAPALSRLRRAEALVRRGWVEAGFLLFLLVWAAGLPPSNLGLLADRLALTGGPGRLLRRWGSTWRLRPRLSREGRRSRIRRSIAGLSPAQIGALASGLPPAASARLCGVAFSPAVLSIGGRDLLEAGAPAGPAIGRALAATLAAREDGMIGASQELDFALRRARGRKRMP